MRKIIVLTLMMVSTTLWGQTMPYEDQTIDQIEINIATDAPGVSKGTDQIKTRLKTREGSLFSQTDFDSDLKMLIQDYDRIEPSVESVNGKIYITLNVWPKPKIREIIWLGNDRITSKKLQGELGIKKNAIFDRQAFTKAFHNVKAFYVKKGFFEAQLEFQADLDTETNEVVITVCIDEGRAGRIKEIIFKGFNKVEQNDIAELMVTKKYNFFLSWLTGTGTYRDEMIQHDEFIILNYLQNQGFADAKVDIDVQEAPQSNRIVLYITAERGPLYHFGEITFEGNSFFTDDQIREKFLFHRGEPYSPEQLHDTLRCLMETYGKYGYIETVVNYTPKREADDYEYDIHITIDEGEQFFIGLVKVYGNTTTQTRVILHETLLTPGEVFNLDKLKLTELKLRNIGYFENVNVFAVKSEGACPLPGNYRDVHIEVEECSTGNFGAFLGFSTTENIFGGFNVTEKNFNICGLRRVFRDGLGALRGGGEYAHLTLTLGQKSTSYGFSWTKPYFMDTPWAVGFDIDHSQNRYISQDYRIKATGLTLHGTYPCNQFVKTGVHYRLRHTDINVTDKATPKLKQEAKNSGITSAVGYNWLYDSTDHPLCPTCGLKSRIDFEFAGVGGRHTFFSIAYLNSWYFNMWDFATLKLRGDVRFIQPLFKMDPDDLPIDERFFLGGDNLIRGYRPYRLGPKFDDDDDEPRGGISMQLASIEMSKCLFSRMDAFIFVDAGYLSMNRWDFFDDIWTSAGFGARLQVFPNAPPLTVGMGYPLNAPSRSDVKKFFMMVGSKF